VLKLLDAGPSSRRTPPPPSLQTWRPEPDFRRFPATGRERRVKEVLKLLDKAAVRGCTPIAATTSRPWTRTGLPPSSAEFLPVVVPFSRRPPVVLRGGDLEMDGACPPCCRPAMETTLAPPSLYVGLVLPSLP
jgi:hypothetical protein